MVLAVVLPSKEPLGFIPCNFLYTQMLVFATFTQLSKLFINDAWNDVFLLQQAMCHHHSSVGDCLQELKVLAENVDGSTSWDSVSMREKALKIMNIANILKHFQRKVEIIQTATSYLEFA